MWPGHQDGPEFIPRPQKSREQKEVLLDSGLLEKAFSGLLNVRHLRVWVLTHIYLCLCRVGWGWGEVTVLMVFLVCFRREVTLKT